jgi:hypothetical protein
MNSSQPDISLAPFVITNGLYYNRRWEALSWDGFNESWAHCGRRKANSNLGKIAEVGRNAQIHNAKLG